ncbi:hypothetical protein D3C76_1288300 [compost metagenome]
MTYRVTLPVGKMLVPEKVNLNSLSDTFSTVVSAAKLESPDFQNRSSPSKEDESTSSENVNVTVSKVADADATVGASLSSTTVNL